MEKKNYFLRLLGLGKLTFVSSALFLSLSAQAQTLTDGLKLHYTFATAPGDIVPDASGNGYNGTLTSGATIGVAPNGKNVLILGADGDDYLDMGVGAGALVAGLNDFTISTFVYVDEATNLDVNGNFIAMFSNSLNQLVDTNGFFYLQAKRSRYAISPKGWQFEESLQGAGNVAKNRWVHLAYTQNGTVGTLYIDGVKYSSGSIALKPSGLGIPTYNFIGKACFAGDVNLMNAMISDFRIYNRVLSANEMLNLYGYPAELITQWNALDLGDLSDVTSNITLPTTMGANGVTVSWASTFPNVISTTGVVNRPDKFVSIVKLTAKLKITIDTKTDSIVKEFTATVNPFNPGSEQIAKWNFASANISFSNGEIKVKDESESEFVGTLKNVASIRTIGQDTLYNVLDLGNNNGYLDLDTFIGKAVYSLTNYTVGAYYYMEPAYPITTTSWGNCLWRFSNAASQGSGGNGVMFMSLTYQGNVTTPTGYGTENGPKLNVSATKGVWKHIAYTQDGDSGRIFIDGVRKLATKCTATPATALIIAGRTGTNFNTIGVPAYVNDSYLKQTLVYGFEMFTVPLTGDDLRDPDICDVTTNLGKLNRAFIKNPKVTLTELDTEVANLTLGDLSAITSNIALPPAGILDPTITIQWRTNRPAVIAASGVVTRPDYLNAAVTLTAVLFKNGQTRMKDFVVTVLPKAGTEFASDLVLNYNFDGALTSGTSVTDAAEKHFTGTLMKGALVDTIGTVGNQHNVLSLTNVKDSAYFDMGTEFGKVVYGLKNHTVSVYYLIDPTKTNLANNGNFLYTFSNSTNSGTDQNGYMFGRASNNSHSISTNYWALGNNGTAGVAAPMLGKFYHYVYTQRDTIGTVYINGDTVSSVTIKNIPWVALPKGDKVGTAYNFIGRPNFAGDVYLSKALLADFKVYKKALTKDEISALQTKTANLNCAYLGQTCLDSNKPVLSNKIRISTSVPGIIEILDLKGNEKVAVYDVMGRKVFVNNIRAIAVKPGMYIVKVNEKVTKVLVK